MTNLKITTFLCFNLNVGLVGQLRLLAKFELGHPPVEPGHAGQVRFTAMLRYYFRCWPPNQLAVEMQKTPERRSSGVFFVELGTGDDIPAQLLSLYQAAQSG